MAQCWKRLLCVVYMVVAVGGARGLNISNNKLKSDNGNEAQKNKIGAITLNEALKNKTEYAGNKASFLCDITGTPKPQYSWKKGLLSLTDINGKIKIKDTLWGSVLKIEDLDFSDEGRYVCQASNPYGQVNTTAFLRVLVKRKPSKEDPDKKIDEDKDAGGGGEGPGFCQTFQSSTCGIYLGGHMVYVTDAGIQSKKERKIASLIAEISAALSEVADQECLRHIMQLTCHYNFLMCGEDRKPRRLCQEDCQDVTKKRCNYTYKLILQKLKSNSDHLISIPKCQTLTNEPSCFKFNKIPPMPSRVNPQAKEIECYNGTGSDYGGTMAQTVQSMPCISWKDVPAYESNPSVEGNYCRNPKLEQSSQPSGPWCFTSTSGNWEICPLRRCSDVTSYQNKSLPNLLPVYISISCVFGFVVVVLIVCWICKKSKYVAQDHCHSGAINRKNYLGIYKPCQSDLKKTDNHILQLNKMKINCNDYPLSQIRFQEQIGEGIFGAVYKAELLSQNNNSQPDDCPNSTVIVKTLSAGSSTSLQQDFKREAQLMNELKHVNVLSLVGVSMRQIPWCMLFDHTERGDLHEMLTSCSTMERRSVSTVPADSMDAYGDVALSYTDRIFIAAQIACGMEYLSSRNFVHRDLAARNVLVGENLLCKICDLGLVRDLYQADYYRSPGSSLMLPVRWMSPEAISYGRFTVESDVWAYGVLLWELWAGGLQPFYGHSNAEAMGLIRARQILPCPDGCPGRVYDLMLECWNELPRYRTSFKSIHARARLWQQQVVEVAPDDSAKSASQSGGSKHTTSSTEMCSDHSNLLSQEHSQPAVAFPVHFSRLPSNSGVYLPELSHIV